MKRESGSGIVNPGGPGIPPTTVVRDPSNPVQMGVGEPFVDDRVRDPAALAYAAGAQNRRRSPLPLYRTPVAGGPDVAIPRLDSEAGQGTMAEQAQQQRMPTVNQLVSEIAQQPALRSGIVSGTAHQASPPVPQQMRSRATPLVVPGLQNGDMLPDEAEQDPTYQQGHGSRFAINQPALALKYGVIRGGERVPPQVLAAGVRSKQGASAGKLRPETVEGLQAMKALEDASKRVTAKAEDRQVSAETAAGPAGGAGETKAPMTDDEVQKLLDSLDDYDISRVKKALFKDMLNNDKQREIIEARLKPLDLTSLITQGRVTQIVPVVPGVFEPEFQSYDGEEDLTIKRLIGIEARLSGAGDRYVLDKYQLMGLTVALRAINKELLPDYLNAEGVFDEALFWQKYDIVSRFNYHMLASMMVNWFWFDARVRKLLKADELGNG